MPKHKTVAHLPATPPAPRLLAQIMTALGELVIVGMGIVGVVVVVNLASDRIRRQHQARAARDAAVTVGFALLVRSEIWRRDL